jgi:hypothetical protein
MDKPLLRPATRPPDQDFAPFGLGFAPRGAQATGGLGRAGRYRAPHAGTPTRTGELRPARFRCQNRPGPTTPPLPGSAAACWNSVSWNIVSKYGKPKARQSIRILHRKAGDLMPPAPRASIPAARSLARWPWIPAYSNGSRRGRSRLPVPACFAVPTRAQTAAVFAPPASSSPNRASASARAYRHCPPTDRGHGPSLPSSVPPAQPPHVDPQYPGQPLRGGEHRAAHHACSYLS